MEFIGEKEKKQVIAVTIIYLLLIFLCVGFLFLRGISNLEPVYILNITADIFGMLTGYVLFALRYYGFRK